MKFLTRTLVMMLLVVPPELTAAATESSNVTTYSLDVAFPIHGVFPTTIFISTTMSTGPTILLDPPDTKACLYKSWEIVKQPISNI
jgi:hypothetical protein